MKLYRVNFFDEELLGLCTSGQNFQDQHIIIHIEEKY